MADANDLLHLGNNITCVPIIHGRSIFAQEVRRIFLEDSYRCVAVELPHSLYDPVTEAVEYLPNITAVVYREISGEFCYVPIEPGEGIIEGIRLAIRERLPIEFIDMEIEAFTSATPALPDEYAIRGVGLSKYYHRILPVLKQVKTTSGSIDDQREQWMASQLRQLDQRFGKVLFICGMAHLEGIRRHFYARTKPVRPESDGYEGQIHSVHPDGIYLLMGEIPYLTYLYEKCRSSLDLVEFNKTDGIKELLLETRKEYCRDFSEELEHLSPATMQLLLKYLRNLCLTQARLTPSMYDLVVAAQGVGGGGFGARTIEMAKFYPFIDPLSPYPLLRMGFRKGWMEEYGEVGMKNRLPGPDFSLKNIRLEQRPTPEKKKQWQRQWGAYSECSWPEEDEKIENFTSYVRRRAMGVLGEDQARIEKFTTSIKDGIDMRETVRQWHTGDIYVKETPVVRGDVGAVVFIFDDSYDKYPWRSTWLAEHDNESTLCFYATEYKEDMVGPGIGRSFYGGALFIFPPIIIPNVWTDPRFRNIENPAELLTAAAVFYSHSRYVAYVSHRKPNLAMRRVARKNQRHLIYLPMSSFSTTTIRRLRKFHVLQGHEIRSYARKYIR